MASQGPQPDLALVRTDLANERTLLAYGRTALMLFGTGISLVRFLNTAADLVLLGWALIGGGLVIGMVGVVRFVLLKRRLRATYVIEAK